MAVESRPEFNKTTLFKTCEEMGEAAVLADLERAGMKFQTEEHKWLAWEWVYSQRLKRDQATAEHLKATAKWTMLVAVCTFFVALFTGMLNFLEFWARH